MSVKLRPNVAAANLNLINLPSANVGEFADPILFRVN